jgi:hypothetical protein
VSYDSKSATATVEWPGQKDLLRFSVGEDRRSRVAFSRNPVDSPPAGENLFPVTASVRLEERTGSRNLPPGFLGLSYESSMLLPQEGKHYFDATNIPLVTMFRTLGIKNLRVGANAVDDPRVAVPEEKDIDALFGFANAAGVKVIYSFRLKNGDPARSAQLAKYIQEHYGNLVDAFAIGNEPNCFENLRKEKYGAFFTLWKPHYDAILQAVPHALIEGPSTATDGSFAISLAKDLGDGGHLPLLSSHYYPFGAGGKAELDPAGTRERFLSETNASHYEKLYEGTAKVIAGLGLGYRIDEMNSCYNGGAKGSSDTYASALWALDWDHWWAAHGIAGLNYHTGESVGMDGGFHAPNYASFVHLPDGKGFDVHPIAYSHLVFSQGARGRILEVRSALPPKVSAYAYRDGDDFLFTIIDREHGSASKPVRISVRLPATFEAKGSPGRWERLDLMQKSGDVSAKSGITLGGSPISQNGSWSGQWKPVDETMPGEVSVSVTPASATILRWTPKT